MPSDGNLRELVAALAQSQRTAAAATDQHQRSCVAADVSAEPGGLPQAWRPAPVPGSGPKYRV